MNVYSSLVDRNMQDCQLDFLTPASKKGHWGDLYNLFLQQQTSEHLRAQSKTVAVKRIKLCKAWYFANILGRSSYKRITENNSPRHIPKHWLIKAKISNINKAHNKNSLFFCTANIEDIPPMSMKNPATEMENG